MRKIINSLVFLELGRTVTNDVDCIEVQKARKGDNVTIHYEGRLKTTGVKFDSSLDREEPITFELGTNQVIPGWEQGLVGTCPGQRLLLEIPSDLGYGSSGTRVKCKNIF
jgi:FK506-binding protein 2